MLNTHTGAASRLNSLVANAAVESTPRFWASGGPAAAASRELFVIPQQTSYERTRSVCALGSTDRYCAQWMANVTACLLHWICRSDSILLYAKVTLTMGRPAHCCKTNNPLRRLACFWSARFPLLNGPLLTSSGQIPVNAEGTGEALPPVATDHSDAVPHESGMI
jgi:hypothetical protein